MVTKNQIKRIKSLHQKKYRKEYQLFIAEGVKVIQELLQSSFVLEHLYVTNERDFDVPAHQVTLVSQDDLKKMSALTTTPNCLAVFHCLESKSIDFSDWVVALDDVRDPGNLGTIIRLCDWFGIQHIVCSPETVDCYNPKVIQATMGSVSRVNIEYTDLTTLLQTIEAPIYGTFLGGENIYKMKGIQPGVIVMGNEANGISSEIEQLVSRKITIPRFGHLQQTESLNVAMATSIVLSEFRRTVFNEQ
ncbi:RNA methyltransferase [Myroides sp. 1354]|uniref:TrmH family RNA methyltransferase n=1 Tax=unclassified Myroides TaxID=2642485 RepID=UPI0025768912|nr:MULTISPECIES: RNA methyltransferase [unclassified Myroides]MDM1044174.1 RNA methyltransferase [Myroides sp. R163-1]MDM1055110.1 RNA methyltransferase [Myroides sp. 1354]MDM1068407.1 RNA methyltransferase [Myroides sp. 1372]